MSHYSDQYEQHLGKLLASEKILETHTDIYKTVEEMKDELLTLKSEVKELKELVGELIW